VFSARFKLAADLPLFMQGSAALWRVTSNASVLLASFPAHCAGMPKLRRFQIEGARTMTKRVALLLIVAISLPCVAENRPERWLGSNHNFLHTISGFSISFLVGGVSERPAAGLVAGIGAGIIKEIMDSRDGVNHRAEMSTALLSTAGSVGAFFITRKVFARRKRRVVASQPATPPPEPNVESEPRSCADPARLAAQDEPDAICTASLSSGLSLSPVGVK
jgi:hypothetical protein